MKTVQRILIGAGALTILLAVLSLTVFNRHFGPTRMESVMRLARLASEERDYGGAADYYRLAIGLDRNKVDAYLLLADACVLDGYPEDAKYYLELGIARTGSERLRKARNSLLALISEDGETEDPPSVPGIAPSDELAVL